MADVAQQPPAAAAAAAATPSSQPTDPAKTIAQTVSSYERSNGTVVDQYKRSAPGTKREEAPGPASANGGTEPDSKRRGITIDELLQMDLAELQKRIVDAQVAVDPEAAAVAKLDSAAAAGDALPGQIPNANVPPGPMGLEDFVNACVIHGSNGNAGDKDTIASIIGNARAGKYNREGGEYGFGSLVPHLQSAGLFKLADEIMNGAFSF